MQQSRPNRIPSHHIPSCPPYPISISFSCTPGATRLARVTAHLIRSKQKIHRPHDTPSSSWDLSRQDCCRANSGTRNNSSLPCCLLCAYGHEADRCTILPRRDTYSRQWLSIIPASPQQNNANWAVLQSWQSSWTPISIRPRGNLLLLVDTVVASTMGRTMSFPRRAARIRGQLCGRPSQPSLIACRSCLPNEPASQRAQPAAPTSPSSQLDAMPRNPSPIWPIPTGDFPRWHSGAHGPLGPGRLFLLPHSLWSLHCLQ